MTTFKWTCLTNDCSRLNVQLRSLYIQDESMFKIYKIEQKRGRNWSIGGMTFDKGRHFGRDEFLTTNHELKLIVSIIIEIINWHLQILSREQIEWNNLSETFGTLPKIKDKEISDENLNTYYFRFIWSVYTDYMLLISVDMQSFQGKATTTCSDVHSCW